MSEELPIFVKWLEFIAWILPVVEKLPKRVRGTISDRMVNLTLDVVEDFIEARYTKNKLSILKKTNLKIEKLRVLLRVAHEQQILPHASYKTGSYKLNEVGKMLGGWNGQISSQLIKNKTPLP